MARLQFSLAALLVLLASVCVKSTWANGYCGNRGASKGWGIPARAESYNGRKATLERVSAVIRHGDRTSWTTTPCWGNDTTVWDCDLTFLSTPNLNTPESEITRLFRKVFIPGKEVKPGNCSIGQLTSIGYRQQLLNGANLRAALVLDERHPFLHDNISAHNGVYIRSDDVPRTVQSAQSLMLGMFPPVPARMTRGVQIVDIHTVDAEVDIMEPSAKMCPRWGEYQRELARSANWTAHMEQVTRPLFAEVSAAIGYPNRTYDQEAAMGIFDCLETHACHGFPLPARLHASLMDRFVADITWQSWQSYLYPNIFENARAGIGFLIKTIYQRLLAAVEGGTGTRFDLYSGHDTTIMPLLAAFGLHAHGDPQVTAWAPYASMVLFELYQLAPSKADPVNHAVRIIYNGAAMELGFCGMRSLCGWDTFADYALQLLPADDKVKQCAV